MTEYKCPFSIVLSTGSCHCRHALEVVRRGGSEFDCAEPAAHSECTTLTRHLNAIGLPAIGHEDDLTQTPKRVYERVLLGGLQGLRMTENPQDKDLQTTDIWTVVATVRQKYGSMDNIPDEDFVPAIASCSIKKRQRKRQQ